MDERVFRDLPRRAMLVVAVRCVDRVTPVLAQRRPEFIELSQELVHVAMMVAKGDKRRVDDAKELLMLTMAEREAPEAVFHLASAVAAVGDRKPSGAKRFAEACWNVWLAASAVARTSDTASRKDFAAACFRDVELLAKRMTTRFPNLGHPLDGGEAGPLGPIIGKLPLVVLGEPSTDVGHMTLESLREERDALASRVTLVETDNQALREVLQEMESRVNRMRREAERAATENIRIESGLQEKIAAERMKAAELQVELSQRQQELEQAQHELDMERPRSWREIVGNVRQVSYATLGMWASVLLLLFFVWIAILCMSEIHRRQQLHNMVQGRIEEVKNGLLLPGGEGNANEAGGPRKLEALEGLRVSVTTLIVSGATKANGTVDGIRDEFERVAKPGQLQPAALNIEMSATWFWWCRPKFWNSNLLLSGIVVLSGTIGAVIAALRENRQTYRQLFLGFAAGFITFLVIRGGKSVFLMQPDVQSTLLNPYTSAFFGLVAGTFTDKAYRLLIDVTDKIVEKLRSAFELPREATEHATSNVVQGEQMGQPIRPSVRDEDEQNGADDLLDGGEQSELDEDDEGSGR